MLTLQPIKMDTQKNTAHLTKDNEYKMASILHRPLTGSYHNLSELTEILFSKPGKKSFLTDNSPHPSK